MRATVYISPPMSDLLRNVDFKKLWTGQTISVFGSMVTRAAIPFAAILALDAGPLDLGLLHATEAVPVLLAGLFAGAWADRVRRRPVMIAADVGRALLLASIPLAAVLGRLTMAYLYVVVALTAGLTVVFNVAYQAYLPGLVGRENIVEGNSKLGMSSALAEVGGFSLGGVLVQVLTAPIAIFVDAVSFLVSGVAIAAIRAPEKKPERAAEDSGIGSEIVEGVRIVMRDGRLRALLLAATTVAVSGGMFGALYTIYVTRELGLSPVLWGVVVACGGIGSFAGAALAERAGRRFGLGRALVVSLAVGGTLQLLVPLAHAPIALAVGCLVGAQIFGDCGLTMYNVQDVSLRQSIAPEHALGRVNATIHFLELGGMPVGALVGGLVGEYVSMRAGVAIGACGMALASLWLLFSPVRGHG
jgi:predicted MFS family arabinose efflux permease